MKKYYCGLDEYASREEALKACDVKAISYDEYKGKFGSNYNTIESPIYLSDGIILDGYHDWNGEKYHDSESGHDYWPIAEYDCDEDGEILQETELLGYEKY